MFPNKKIGYNARKGLSIHFDASHVKGGEDEDQIEESEAEKLLDITGFPTRRDETPEDRISVSPDPTVSFSPQRGKPQPIASCSNDSPQQKSTPEKSSFLHEIKNKLPDKFSDNLNAFFEKIGEETRERASRMRKSGSLDLHRLNKDKEISFLKQTHKLSHFDEQGTNSESSAAHKRLSVSFDDQEVPQHCDLDLKTDNSVGLVSRNSTLKKRSSLSVIPSSHSSVLEENIKSDTSSVHTSVKNPRDNFFNKTVVFSQFRQWLTMLLTFLFTTVYKSQFFNRRKLFIVLFILLNIYAFCLPTYLLYFVSGAFFSSLLWYVYIWLFIPSPSRSLSKPPKPLNLYSVPQSERISFTKEKKVKGWMNEIQNYDVKNYHLSQTHSVYVQLEGNKLRLQSPKQGIPKKIMWDSGPIQNPTFVFQRHYSLENCKVSLLPEGLVCKRLWSKKYPICLSIPSQHVHNLSSSPGSEKNSSPLANNHSETKEFEMVDFSSCQDKNLFLFARTCREKEFWFRHFLSASKSSSTQKISRNSSPKMSPSYHSLKRGLSSPAIDLGPLKQKEDDSKIKNVSSNSTFDLPLNSSDEHADNSKSDFQILSTANHEQYVSRMAYLVASHGSPDSTSALLEAPLTWVNVLLTRLTWNLLRNDVWIEFIKNKIQRKLNKLHVPYFIEDILVTGLNTGEEIPLIKKACPPYLDDRGLWVDFDIVYNGGLEISLETKVNLMKLKEKRLETKPTDDHLLAAFNEEEEDSGESSTDEDYEEQIKDANNSLDEGVTQSTSNSKKLLRIVDKIAQSKYFQHATENRYIKKAMTEVSNTRILLNVELKRLAGTLAVNFPPPPSDRLWYGFRSNPQMVLSAKPQVGERVVTVTHITDWIERKLAHEFQSVLVMPNMDDIHIPLLCDSLNM